MGVQERTDLQKSDGPGRPFFWLADTAPVLVKSLPERPVHVIDVLPRGSGAGSKVETMAQSAIEMIRPLQASGPYMLGGYSGMAVVVFEVAQQLLAQGEEVCLLVLLDPCPLTQGKDGKPGRFYFRSNTRFYFARRAMEHWRKFIALGPGKRASYIAYRVRCILGRSIPAVVDAPAEADFLNALSNYEPKSYPGLVAYFVTEKTLADFKPAPYLGWKDLIRGGFALHRIPGDHHSLWYEPHLGVFIKKLNECFAAANADSSVRLAG